MFLDFGTEALSEFCVVLYLDGIDLHRFGEFVSRQPADPNVETSRVP